MEKQKWKKILENPWKLAFFTLLGILIGSIFFLFIRITDNREPRIEKTHFIKSDSSFEIQLTKRQTNQIINSYLKELQKKSKIKYNFTLENQALLRGNFIFLGHRLNFYLYFEPYVIDNGDVKLKVKSISIGTLSLPNSELMKFMKNNFKLPSWVEIDGANEIIVLHLKQFKLKNGIYFEVKQINLVDDIIKLNVHLPKN
jgi:uncharacterized protein YpmS